MFQVKAHLGSTDWAARPLRAPGVEATRLARTTLADVPPGLDRDRLLRRRADIGLPTDDAQPLLVEGQGKALPNDAVETHLRHARSVRVSAEWNSGYCRSVLVTRYGPEAGDA